MLDPIRALHGNKHFDLPINGDRRNSDSVVEACPLDPHRMTVLYRLSVIPAA